MNPKQWETLWTALPSVEDLELLAMSCASLNGDMLGPEFRALLSRLRRLELQTGLSEFVEAVVDAVGPFLRELVLSDEVPLPSAVRERLLSFCVGSRVLIPRPSILVPADFLTRRMNKLFE
jgi:hypothetical protein